MLTKDTEFTFLLFIIWPFWFVFDFDVVFCSTKLKCSLADIYWIKGGQLTGWLVMWKWNSQESNPNPWPPGHQFNFLHRHCHIWIVLNYSTLRLFNCLFSRTTWVRQYQNSLDLNKARDDGVSGWQWHQLDHMQTVCASLQTDIHTNTSSLNFCRPDALPDA